MRCLEMESWEETQVIRGRLGRDMLKGNKRVVCFLFIGVLGRSDCWSNDAPME